MRKIVRLSDIIIPKYQRIFNSKKIHQIITSGRAGTKSSFMGIKAIYTIASPKPGSVVILRKRHNKLRKTVYKEVIRAIKRLGMEKSDFNIRKSPMQITCKATGNTIYFTGSDSVDDTKGIIDEDRPIVLVVLDELTEFFDQGEGADELANIEATFVRGNDEAFTMLYLFNPPKNPNAPIMAWTETMEKRPDCIRIHSDYRDVPESWIGKILIKTAEQMKLLDEKLYNWIWLGLCTGVDDLIYYMFNREIHVEEPDAKEIREIGIGVDYGQKNATTFEAFGVNYSARKLQGLDEYYHSGRDSGQKAPSQYARDFKAFCDGLEKTYGHPVTWVTIDPSARGLAEEIKRIMPNITWKPADNSVALGISRTQKLLTYRCMSISDKQPHLQQEMGLYQYDEKSIERGTEEPLKKNDHCQDATRYVVMAFWRIVKYLLPVTERV